MERVGVDGPRPYQKGTAFRDTFCQAGPGTSHQLAQGRPFRSFFVRCSRGSEGEQGVLGVIQMFVVAYASPVDLVVDSPTLPESDCT